MKVLKFGGSSVANPENIRLVKSILQEQEQRVVVVVSAFGGVTDQLLEAIEQASRQDGGYHDILTKLEERHLNTIKSLLPVQDQSAVLSKVKAQFNTLETLLEGAYLIGETTPKLSDKIVSFGELLSGYIIGTYLKADGMDAEYKDSRELIVTLLQHKRALVDYDTTLSNCKRYFSAKNTKFIITLDL